jgi:hypothetical protein
VVLADSQFTHYRNGTSIDSGTHTFGTASDRLVVGAELTPAPYVDMEVAAVLVYDRALNGTERQQVEGYLQETYLDATSGTASTTAIEPAPAFGSTSSDVTASASAAGPDPTDVPGTGTGVSAPRPAATHGITTP